MGKIVYTERDIELLASRGVTDIPVNEDVIVTAVAREKMEKLGMKTRAAAPGEANLSVMMALGMTAGQPVERQSLSAERESVIERAKAAVIARLGPGVDPAVVERAVRAVVSRMYPSTE